MGINITNNRSRNTIMNEFKFGKTAAYTILKNESKFIEKWLYYTAHFDYRVLLDTGSADGSWEMLQEEASKDKNLIIEQKIITPWHFSNARNYNLTMIPDDVTWALSPDLDEYFSINVIDEMNKIISSRPDVTNIATTRLDLYSKTVFVGPPHQLPSNKIHRRHDYYWYSPIYEHLKWKHENIPEVELYSDKIFLIHDQDFKKKERSPLYLKMLLDEYKTNPSNCWTLWFLVNHYYIEKDFENFVKTGCDFVKFNTQQDNKYNDVLNELTAIYHNYPDCPPELKELIRKTISGKSL